MVRTEKCEKCEDWRIFRKDHKNDVPNLPWVCTICGYEVRKFKPWLNKFYYKKEE